MFKILEHLPNFHEVVHRTKKLLARSTSVWSDISYFHNEANRVDPDQAALIGLPDLGLLCLQMC